VGQWDINGDGVFFSVGFSFHVEKVIGSCNNLRGVSMDGEGSVFFSEFGIDGSEVVVDEVNMFLGPLGSLGGSAQHCNKLDMSLITSIQ
jgi:hypothetical protein